MIYSRSQKFDTNTNFMKRISSHYGWSSIKLLVPSNKEQVATWDLMLEEKRKFHAGLQ